MKVKRPLKNSSSPTSLLKKADGRKPRMRDSVAKKSRHEFGYCDTHRLCQNTQPMAWRRFERMCTINPVRQFYKSFENA